MSNDANVNNAPSSNRDPSSHHHHQQVMTRSHTPPPSSTQTTTTAASTHLSSSSPAWLTCSSFPTSSSSSIKKRSRSASPSSSSDSSESSSSSSSSQTSHRHPRKRRRKHKHKHSHKKKAHRQKYKHKHHQDRHHPSHSYRCYGSFKEKEKQYRLELKALASPSSSSSSTSLSTSTAWDIITRPSRHHSPAVSPSSSVASHYQVDRHGMRDLLLYQRIEPASTVPRYRRIDIRTGDIGSDPMQMIRRAWNQQLRRTMRHQHRRQRQRQGPGDRSQHTLTKGSLHDDRYYRAMRRASRRLKDVNIGHRDQGQEENPYEYRSEHDDDDGDVNTGSSGFIPLLYRSGNRDLEEEEEEEEKDTDADLIIGEGQRRTAEFRHLLRQHPQDEHLWLSFAQFQRYQPYPSRDVSRRMRAERSVGVLREAVQAVPWSERILAALIDAAIVSETTTSSSSSSSSSSSLSGDEQHRGPSPIQALFRKVISRRPDSGLLWQRYTEHSTGSFSRFSVPGVIHTFQRGMRVLLSVKGTLLSGEGREGRGPPLEEEEDRRKQDRIASLDERLLELAMELSDHARRWGNPEMGTALLQALVEMNWCCPVLIGTWRRQLREFRSFWESEAPRMGDEDGDGWDRVIRRRASLPDGTERVMDPGDDPDPDTRRHIHRDRRGTFNTTRSGTSGSLPSPYVRWAIQETWMDQNALVSRKASEHPNQGRDPDDGHHVVDGSRDDNDTRLVFGDAHVIMFADISRFLFPVTRPLVQHTSLPAAFLDHLGVPVFFSLRPVSDRFLHRRIESALFHRLAYPPSHSPHRHSRASYPDLKCFPDDEDSHTHNGSTTAALERILEWRPYHHHHHSYGTGSHQSAAFIRRVFDFLCRRHPHHPNDALFPVLRVLWERHHYGTQSARRAARELLAEREGCMPLWHVYAEVEMHAGRFRRVRQVYDQVLTQLTTSRYRNDEDGSSPQEGNNSGGWDVLLMARGYAEAEIRSGRWERALLVLCRAAAPGVFQPPRPPPQQQREQGEGEGKEPTMEEKEGATTKEIQRARRLYGAGTRELKRCITSGMNPEKWMLDCVMSMALLSVLECSRDDGGGKQFHATSAAVFDEVLDGLPWPTPTDPHPAFMTFTWSLSSGTNHAHHNNAYDPVNVGDQPEQYLWLLYLRFLLLIPHTPPAVLRSVLQRCLHRFPSHPSVLALLMHSELRTGTAYHFRRFMDRLITAAPSPIPVQAAVEFEIRFAEQQFDSRRSPLTAANGRGNRADVDPMDSLGGGGGGEQEGRGGKGDHDNRHRVRSLLERALTVYPDRYPYLGPRRITGPGTQESGECAHSALLWLTYLRYEGRVMGDGRRMRAVFYRAMERCPGNKVMWLDAMGMLGEREETAHDEEEELRDLYDMMLDKGMVLRSFARHHHLDH